MRDDRAHFDALIKSATDDTGARGLGEDSTEFLCGVAHGDSHRTRQTALARAPERAVGHDADRHFDIGVGQHDDRVLRAALALRAFAVRGGAGIHVPRDRRRADKTHCANRRVVENRIDGIARTVHQVDNALRKAGLFNQPEQRLHRHRNFFRGFHDAGIAAGQRVGQKPHRDHRREVERTDDGGDSDRLANHEFVNARGDVLRVISLQQDGHTAGNFDILDSALQLAPRFSKGLAAFERGGACDVVKVALQQGFQLVKELRAIVRRRAAPRGIGLGSGVGRGGNFRGAAKRSSRQRLAGRWVDHVQRFARR